MFEGMIPALVTPFKNGSVDKEALRNHVENMIAGGASALLPCGTTGEAATMTLRERKSVIKITVKQAAKRVPVIAGVGTNHTETTLEGAKAAKSAGADALLVVTPYYNKPPQHLLYEHFAEVASKGGLPIILYNVPSRTGCDLLPDTVARLAQLEQVVGIKEATGSVTRAAEIMRLCGHKLSIYSGDDATAFFLFCIGCQGVISVTGNLMPRDMTQLYQASKNGDLKTAREIYLRLLPIMNALFIEANPIPLKTALAMMGHMEEEFRMPLGPMAGANKEIMASILRQEGVLR